MAAHQALLFRQLSADVVLFLHGAARISAEDATGAAGRPRRPVVDGPVAEVVVEDDRLTGVRLADGRVVALDAVVVAPTSSPRRRCWPRWAWRPEPVEMGGEAVGTQVAADPTGAPTVPGVWVAGNVGDADARR